MPRRVPSSSLYEIHNGFCSSGSGQYILIDYSFYPASHFEYFEGSLLRFFYKPCLATLRTNVYVNDIVIVLSILSETRIARRFPACRQVKQAWVFTVRISGYRSGLGNAKRQIKLFGGKRAPADGARRAGPVGKRRVSVWYGVVSSETPTNLQQYKILLSLSLTINLYFSGYRYDKIQSTTPTTI